MDKYSIESPISIDLPLNGVADITGITWSVDRVSPDTATVVVDQVVGPTETVATFNLAPGDLSGIRSVFRLNYTLHTAGGDTSFYLNFIGESEDPLVVGENSYQDYFSALLIAEDVALVDAFKGASKSDQVSALINAYHVINTMTFIDKYAEYYDLGILTEAELLAMEAAFLRALKIAQVVEASEMLDRNSLHYKRLDGLMSETIGESSMMFRPGNVNNYPITRRSLNFLRNYILLRARLYRA